jgi:hypothetical protein
LENNLWVVIVLAPDIPRSQQGTVHVVDTGYEKTIEKAADKMLEALDASLKRCEPHGCGCLLHSLMRKS